MIVNAVSSGTTGNVTLGFQADPNMIVGDHVTTSGIGGNIEANQTNVTISAVQPRHNYFMFIPGLGTAGELISIASDSTATFCTVNLTVQPNVFVNQWAWVSGLQNFDHTDPNNLYASQITAVGTNSFTINCPVNAITPTTPNTTFNTSGCSNTSCYATVVTEPFVTLNATNTGSWDGRFNGTMVSAENLKNFAEINFTPLGAAVSSRLQPCRVRMWAMAITNSSACWVARHRRSVFRPDLCRLGRH
jgi:hypothetical protein